MAAKRGRRVFCADVRCGTQSGPAARLCPPPPPGSGRMLGTGTCRGCGNRAASEPMTCVVCRGSGRAGVGVEEVCCVGVGGGVSCRYCGVSDGFDGCGGLQKGLCRRNGDSFRLVHRTDSVPAVRAQKRGPRIPAGIGAPLVRLVRLMRSGRFPRCDTQR